MLLDSCSHGRVRAFCESRVCGFYEVVVSPDALDVDER